MKSRMFAVSALLLILILVPGSILFAGGKQEGTTGEVPTIDWWAIEWGYVTYTSDLLVVQALEKAGNVNINISGVPGDVYRDKFNTQLASRDLPDVMFTGNRWSRIKEYGPQGVLLPVSDYLDQTPHFKEYVDKYPVEYATRKSSDGKLYYYPTISDVVPANSMICLREDLLEKGAMKISGIKTTADLYQALKTLKSQTDGYVYGTRGGKSLSGFNRMAQLFGTSVNDIVFFDTTMGKYVSPYDADHIGRTKAAVEYFVKLGQEEILHPDWPIMSDGEWDSGCKNGEVLFFADNGQTMDGYNFVLQQTNPDARWAAVGKITYKKQFYPWASGLTWQSWNGHMVFSQTKAVDQILKIFDFMYDPENHDIFVYGEEGVTYEVRPNGRKVYKYEEASEEWQKIGFNTYGLNTTNFIKVWELPEYFGYHMRETDEGGAFEQGYDTYSNSIYTVKLVPTNFTSEQGDRIDEIRTPATTYVRENITKFILGQRPMDEWDDYVEGLEQFKTKEAVDIYNSAMIKVE